MKIDLLKIKEDNRRIIYKINQDVIILNDKKFKIKKSTTHFSMYLNTIGKSLIEVLNESINTDCIHCSNKIKHNFFARNRFVTYKYCKDCDNRKIIKLYKVCNCIICHKQSFYKNMVFSTCGSDDCLKKHRHNINEKIKNNHWSKTSKQEEIQNKKVTKRLENDKKYNRKYKA